MKSDLKLRLFFTAIIISIIAVNSLCSAQTNPAKRWQIIKDLQPVGYWPADDGVGQFIRDRSGNDNHGRIYQVPWEGDLLNFTGAFQWVEIPSHSAYQSRDFTIGGWVYTRTEVIGGGWRQRWGLTFFGNGFHTSGFTLDTLYDKLVVYGKSQWRVFGGDEGGVSLCIRGDEFIDVVSGGKPDVVGSRAGEAGIEIGKWQHILYTFQAGAEFEAGEKLKQLKDRDKFYNAGTGTLYINGKPVKTAKSVPFQTRDMKYLIGSDAVWWLQANVSGSLNGSVRDMVIFDRALSAQQVRNIYQSTEPEAVPKPLKRNDRSDCEFENARLSQLIEMLEDQSLPQEKRAKAALSIAEKGDAASEAAESLKAVLNNILQTEGERLLNIEDLLRNAAIKALLDIGADSEQSRLLLGLVYAKPFFDSIDISKPYLSEVKPLVQQGRFMDAFDKYRTLDLRENGDFFFSQGDINRDMRQWQPNIRAYTSTAEHNGYTYKAGTGQAWEGVERVPYEEYKELLVDISQQYPEVLNWRSVSYDHLYRVVIRKICPDGDEQRIFLEGDKFILDGRDEKLRGWSIAVDTDGYLHLTGGMHNAPDAPSYIPGSWEQIGASREYTSDDYPTMMYWVSTQPGDIETLKFAGQRANRRNVPAPLGMNYMNFVQDRHGVLYLYGRIHVQGIQSWGMYRYDTKAKRWSGVGGFAPDVKKEFPVWADKNIMMAADWLSLATLRWRNDAPENTVLVWARQPHFYNYMRGWGVRFDRNNRMHIHVPVFGLDKDNQNLNRRIYAYSEDGGRSFRRADGSEVRAPLTVNPLPQNNADLDSNSAIEWFDLWQSLIRYAGFEPLR